MTYWIAIAISILISLRISHNAFAHTEKLEYIQFD